MTADAAPYQNTRPGPVPRWLGNAVEPIYRAIIARRNRRFDALRGVVEVDRPVISVGNLSVGGTGKTPVVRWLVQLLREAGHRPAVAMRGYGARGGRSADEAMDYAAAFADVPIVAQPDRLGGLLDLFASEDGARVDCVVLDDGFQHRRLARQCDVVLIDATRDPFEDRLLPAGWLREPVASLARADAVVITHGEAAGPGAVERITQRVRAVSLRAGIAVAAHAWDGLNVSEDGRLRQESVRWLAGRRVLACCAIGNPGPFLAAVRHAAGVPLAGEVTLADHDPYSPATVRSVVERATASGAQAVVMTSKDWVKVRLLPGAGWPCPVVVPHLVLEWRSGRDGLEATVRRVAGMRLDAPDEPESGEAAPAEDNRGGAS